MRACVWVCARVCVWAGDREGNVVYACAHEDLFGIFCFYRRRLAIQAPMSYCWPATIIHFCLPVCVCQCEKKNIFLQQSFWLFRTWGMSIFPASRGVNTLKSSSDTLLISFKSNPIGLLIKMMLFLGKLKKLLFSKTVSAEEKLTYRNSPLSWPLSWRNAAPSSPSCSKSSVSAE